MQTLKQSFVATVLCMFFSSTFAKSDLLGTDYKHLKYWFMRSYGIKQEDLQPKQEAHEDKKANFALPSYDMLTKQLMIFDILEKSKNDVFAPEHITEEQHESLKALQRDLEVFCGDGRHPEINLAAVTDRTVSATGSVVYRKMLANPIASSNIEAFRARQALIQMLVEDDVLFNRVDDLCAQLAENEVRMLSNWQDIDSISNQVFDKTYFNNGVLKRFNTSPAMMETVTRALNFGTAYSLCAMEIAMILGVANELYAADCRQENPNASFMGSLRTVASGAWTALSYLNPIKYLQFANEAIENARLVSESDAYIAKSTLYVGVPCAAAAFLAFKVYTTKKILDDAILTKNANNFLQERLIGLGSLVHSVELLENLVRRYPVLAEGLVSWQQASDLLNLSGKDEFTSLVNLLQTNTFKGESSFFSLTGRVLAAHKMALTERDKFAGALEVMGELDACLSAAKLYKEFVGHRVTYCFADITHADKPHIRLQNFWNPFVDPMFVVENDLELGGSLPEHHVVLTGSNTGGKSTVGLKGTLINLYLAHTIGLAPAQSCELSLFTDFSSYIHVVDDVASRESAFQAEINRANSLIKAVKSLSKDQFAFVVIDELFKGTNPEKGAPGAMKVIRHLADYDNLVFIIATHYKELTALQDELDSIVNMKMEIFEDEAGNLIKPYKLERGISTHNVADNLMDSGLDIGALNI